MSNSEETTRDPDPHEAATRRTGGGSGKLWLRIGLMLLLMLGFVMMLAGPSNDVWFERFQSKRIASHEFVWLHPLRSVAIYLVVYTLVSALAFPGAALLTMIGGDLFGPRMATVYTVLAATLGATISFLGSRWLFRGPVMKRFPHAAARVDHAVGHDPLGTLLALRLVPIFPFCVVNLVLGLTRVNVYLYVLTTLIGIIPGTLVFAFAGRRIGGIDSLSDVMQPPVLIVLGLLGVAVMVPGWLAARWRKRGLFRAPAVRPLKSRP